MTSLIEDALMEGEAGVGKTEIAKVLSDMLDRELLRLQCYEGLDITTAVYDCLLYTSPSLRDS